MVETQPEMSEKFRVEASAFQAQPLAPDSDLFTDLCLRGMLAKAVVLWDQLPGGGPSGGLQHGLSAGPRSTGWLGKAIQDPRAQVSRFPTRY